MHVLMTGSKKKVSELMDLKYVFTWKSITKMNEIVEAFTVPGYYTMYGGRWLLTFWELWAVLQCW